MAALGQFSQGPIQFGDDGAIEARGTIDQPTPSVTGAPASPTVPNPAGAPDGGGVLPPDSFGSATDSSNISPPGDSASIMSEPDTLEDTPDNHGSDFNSTGQDKRAVIGSFNNALGADFSHNINSAGTHFQIGFDDGGQVDPDGESDGTEGQGASSATVDPMSMIKQAASFGRKKFGLPINFSTGQSEQGGQSQTMGFDDGGMIPDDTQGDDTPPEQGGNVTGGGNTPDPRKALAYLTGDGAVSPEIAGALERHVDQAGQMDPAERTMAAINAAPSDEAKFGMMQHYRTRYNAFSGGAKAALDQGNLGQAAAHATQAFVNVPTGNKVKFAPAQGGIAVMAAPLQGMRQFMGAGLLGKAPVRAADDAWEKYHGDGAQSLADGGEVEEEDTDSGLPAGVLPDPEGLAATDADQPDIAPEQDTGSAQPKILTPEQFKKLLSAGYDKPVDEGWEGLMKSIMDVMGPNTAEAGTLPQPGQQHPTDQSGQGGVTTVGKSDRQPISPALQSQMSTPTPLAQAPQNQQATKPTEDREAKYQAVLERAQKTAAQIFPWASQEAQRSQYVQQQMSHYGDSENKIDQIGATGREGAATVREQGRMAVETMREAGRNQRQTNSAHSREDIARMNNAYRSFNSAQREQVRLLGQQLAADPSLARDPNKAMQRVQQISGQLNINPQDLMAIVKNGGTPPQPSQTAPAPSQGGGAAPKPTVVVFPSGPYAGKPMIRQPDGTYVLAPH